MRHPRTAELDDSFKLRLSGRFQDVYYFFEILYPNHDRDKHLEALVSVLIRNYLERPKHLKALDREREKDPQWFVKEKIVGMMLYVDRFAKDLKGLKNHLSYLEELGINLIHLMPISKCPEAENDGGYAVSDYRSINPKIGTMKDVHDLATHFREKDMYLMMDLVLNHTSDQHEWAEKAKKGDQKYQDYYYFYQDRRIPDQFEASLPQVFPETAPGNFTYIQETGKWVMTVFHDYQWDLNYSNPEVFIEMVDTILFLANQGIDILRLDALAFMWKKIGTSSQNLDEAHMLIKALKSSSKVAAPALSFLAEAIVAPHEIIKYFGEVHEISNECDLAYNATLMTLLWDGMATKNNRLLWNALHNVPRKPRGTTWLNYVRCHDDIGLGYEDEHARLAGYEPWHHRQFLINFLTGQLDWSFARGRKFMEDKTKGDARISGSLASLAGLEKALFENDAKEMKLAVDRIILLHSIMMSFGGIPLLYSGDEIGMINDYSFENEPGKSHDNRWMHRPKMDWKKAENRKKKDSIEFLIFSALQKMIKLRKQTPEFADNDNCHLVDCHNQHLFSYLRVFESHRTWVVCNLNDHSETISLEMFGHMGIDQKNIRDSYTDKKLKIEGHGYLLKPYEFVWIRE